MGAIDLHARASADYEAKLGQTQQLLVQAASEFAPLKQASDQLAVGRRLRGGGRRRLGRRLLLSPAPGERDHDHRHHQPSVSPGGLYSDHYATRPAKAGEKAHMLKIASSPGAARKIRNAPAPVECPRSTSRGKCLP